MKMVALGEVATIERRGVDPSTLPPHTAYLGLEHIERGGRIIGRSSVAEAELASTKFRFSADHILFGKLRPNLGKISRPDFDGVCSTDILPIRAGRDLDRGYLAHYLSQPSMVDFAASRTSGANLPRLSPTVLAQFPIPLPPVPEQRRIAAILDHADALRVKRRQVLAHLDALTRSIFHDMFGADRYTSRPLEQVADPDDRINYGVVQPGDETPDGVPLIRVSDMVRGRIDRTNLKRISPTIEASYQRSRIRGNEILVSSVGSIGAVSVVGPADVGSNIARAITRVPVSDEVLRTYVAAYLRTPTPQHYFIAELRTVAQPTLNVGQLAATLIPLPPVSLQAKFRRRLQRVEELIHTVRTCILADDELFASLQSRAFDGRL